MEYTQFLTKLLEYVTFFMTTEILPPLWNWWVIWVNIFLRLIGN